jgi:hypothetical protein
MAFRIKDLLINIAPGEEDGEGWMLGLFVGCGATPTPTHGWAVQLDCPGPTVVGPREISLGTDPAVAGEHLKKLKSQLQKALEDVESEPPGPYPRTVAEIEELQVKLRAALAELDRRKSELKDK